MAKRTTPADPAAVYTPPQRCFGPCRQCGTMVQGRTWVGGAWREETPRLTPILGAPHRHDGEDARDIRTTEGAPA